jgi:hypothetical protein
MFATGFDQRKIAEEDIRQIDEEAETNPLEVRLFCSFSFLEQR